MEIVYPRACGIDVHKSFIVAVIRIFEFIEPKYIKKRFSTFNNQLIKFREFTRYQYKLVNIHSSEKNRFQNALSTGNCKIDLAFTDIFLLSILFYQINPILVKIS